MAVSSGTAGGGVPASLLFDQAPSRRVWTRSATAAACGSCVTSRTARVAGAAELRQQREDLGAALAVEVAGRLVGEDQSRLVDERACDRDSLSLTAGQAVPARGQAGRSPTRSSQGTAARRARSSGTRSASSLIAAFSIAGTPAAGGRTAR